MGVGVAASHDYFCPSFGPGNGGGGGAAALKMIKNDFFLVLNFPTKGEGFATLPLNPPMCIIIVCLSCSVVKNKNIYQKFYLNLVPNIVNQKIFCIIFFFLKMGIHLSHIR